MQYSSNREGPAAWGIVCHSPFFDGDDGGQPSGEMSYLEIEPTEKLQLRKPWRTRDTRWELVRQPERGCARLEGGRLVATSTPGIYTIRCVTDGLWERTLHVAAMPLSELYPQGQRTADVRKQMRGWLNSPERTREEIESRIARGVMRESMHRSTK